MGEEGDEIENANAGWKIPKYFFLAATDAGKTAALRHGSSTEERRRRLYVILTVPPTGTKTPPHLKTVNKSTAEQ